MASRIFWVLLAGAALVTGMVVQDGGRIFSWDSDHHSRVIDAKVDKAVDREVDKAIDSAWADSDVVTIDGREIRVSDAQKEAMASAIGRLVKSEANLAALKIGGSGDEELKAATEERDRARTDVEQIKAQMIAQRDAQRSDPARTSQETQKEVRDEIRESIRESVRG